LPVHRCLPDRTAITSSGPAPVELLMTKVGGSDPAGLYSGHGRFQTPESPVSGPQVPHERAWPWHDPRQRLTLSPQWDYARRRAPEDDDTGRRGVAPNVEPPPGSPEFRAAEATLAAFQDAPSQPKTASTAVGALGVTDAAEWVLRTPLASLAARAAPIALATVPPVAAALPLIAFPTFNSEGQALPLGDRFRARRPPGLDSVIVERRINDGLLGTGGGAKWEELPPLGATLRVGQYGLGTLVVDADQLRNTVGSDMTKQLFATGRVIDRRAIEIDEAADRARAAPGGQDDLPPPPPLSLPLKDRDAHRRLDRRRHYDCHP
jgi:hypothetical protein